MNGKDSLLDIFIITSQCSKNKDKALKATWKEKIKVICRRKWEYDWKQNSQHIKLNTLNHHQIENQSSEKKNGIEPEIQYIIKQSFKYERKIKYFHAVRTFIIQETILKKLLQNILQHNKNEPRENFELEKQRKQQHTI